MTAQSSSPIRRLVDRLMSPNVRQHLAIVGTVCLVVGVPALAFLPDGAAIWLIVAVVVIAHAGLLMVAGSLLLRRLAKRH